MSEGSLRNKLISLMKELPVNQILCNFDTLIEVCFYETIEPVQNYLLNEYPSGKRIYQIIK